MLLILSWSLQLLPASLFALLQADSELRGLVSHNNGSDVRQEIRETYVLSPGARVELSGLNGPVKIETSDNSKAEVYIERTASTQEALDRRKVIVEADSNSLRIRRKGRQRFLLQVLWFVRKRTRYTQAATADFTLCKRYQWSVHDWRHRWSS